MKLPYPVLYFPFEVKGTATFLILDMFSPYSLLLSHSYLFCVRNTLRRLRCPATTMRCLLYLITFGKP